MVTSMSGCQFPTIVNLTTKYIIFDLLSASHVGRLSSAEGGLWFANEDVGEDCRP